MATKKRAKKPRQRGSSPRVIDNPNKAPRKIILEHYLSPGDVVVMTAAIRDLHLSNPGKFITDVRTSCSAIFENNPYVTHIDDDGGGVTKIKAEYNLIHECNEGAHHFIHGFAQDLEKQLGVNIHVSKLKGDIHISDDEKSWYSQIHEILGKDVPYWIVDAGSKNDYTAKQWEPQRFQQVVSSCPDITFVQIGAEEHNHAPLEGDNLINLIGKTDMRQLIRLIYNSYGVITPVSLPMHLAAAIEMHPRFKRKTRPCIVIAGGREPSVWEAYTNHAYLHTCGMLSCCDNGGCWKSRTVPLDDKDDKNKSLCVYPVKTDSGVFIPRCLDMITAAEVILNIKRYMSWEMPK